MNPKEQLRKTVTSKIEDLPVVCKEDFCRLISLLTRFNELAGDRQQHYQDWVLTVFQKNRAQGLCSFCGLPLPVAGDDQEQCFCSAECKDEWKRNILLVLAAYM